MNNSFLVDEKGFYGEFGGAYVPEILYATVENLRREYLPIIDSEDFRKEYAQLLRDFVGRPSPLYFAKRMSERYGCKLYLKREDLNHTGAHKINNTIGQILLAKKMGKKRIIAETGAGQHGVATAIVCALMDMPRVVYQGALDVERQNVNVERMKMLGADAAENGGVKIICYGSTTTGVQPTLATNTINTYGTSGAVVVKGFEVLNILL